MLIPYTCTSALTKSQTRQGTTFSPYTISALSSQDFDFSALLAESIAKESDEQEDHEHEDDLEDTSDLDEPAAATTKPVDPLNDIDDIYPPPLPPDPFNEVDDWNPHPDPAPPTTKRRRTAFDDMRDGKKPLTGGQRAAGSYRSGSHRRRAAKNAKNRSETDHVPRASTIHDHVQSALPIHTSLDTEALPAAHGGYTAKAEDTNSKRGSKKRYTLADLVKLGFDIVEWNGL